MKPDWKDAPEWANYLAMDENGAWWWYEMEPVFLENIWVRGGEDQDAKCHDWQDSLEEKPKK